ncbi:MAG: [protein-PII] uridylyltransferase, partial [Alcanivorax sp.]|nr:[protein-PII] uridylyltransferase [Alcanivorax sp.]
MNKNTIETQASDTTFVAENPISHYTESISQHTEQISGAFWSGAPISDLLHSRSDLIDGILINSWNHYLAKDLDCFTLVAIGGYGRREMHPYSDIDILLLHCDNIDQRQTHALEDFLRLLWDIGLKLGHRVSTVDECRESALEDQVYTTALLESRLLYGP